MKHLIRLLIVTVIVVCSCNVFAEDRVPITEFEGIVFRFGQNLKIPLENEWVNSPGVDTNEIYLRRGQGHWIIIVFGMIRGEWIGFLAKSQASVNGKSFTVQFQELQLAEGLHFNDVIKRWNSLVGALKDAEALPAFDTAPHTSLYERRGGGVPERVAHAKTYFLTEPKHHLELYSELKKALGIAD